MTCPLCSPTARPGHVPVLLVASDKSPPHALHYVRQGWAPCPRCGAAEEPLPCTCQLCERRRADG